jgi:chromosomal replication initiation ATPase DnaA
MHFDNICTGCGRPIYALRREEYMDVIDQICAEYGVSVAEVLGNSRIHDYVYARQACFFALQKVGLSSTQIGRLMNRDHSTVLYGIRTHKERMNRVVRLKQAGKNGRGAEIADLLNPAK